MAAFNGQDELVVECAPYFVGHTMLSTANITMQFGAKPLFENVSVKFGDGNRYGLISLLSAKSS